jgi:hypothetical protein
VNRRGISLAHKSAIALTRLQLCKQIIKQSPREHPPPLVGGEDVTISPDVKIIEDLILLAYGSEEQRPFGKFAIRLLRPYLQKEEFKSNLFKLVGEEHSLALRRLEQLDILIQAHELSLPGLGRPPKRRKFEPGQRLLDILELKQYSPLTLEKSFFIFGGRLDHELGLNSYIEACRQLRVDREKDEAFSEKDAVLKLLDVVLCAIDHLPNE